MYKGMKAIDTYDKLKAIFGQVEGMISDREIGLTTFDPLLDSLDRLRDATVSAIEEAKCYVWDFVNDSHSS